MMANTRKKRSFNFDSYLNKKLHASLDRRHRVADTAAVFNDTEHNLRNELNKKENLEIYKLELAQLILGKTTLDACHAFTAANDLACVVAMLSMHKVCSTPEDARIYMNAILQGRGSNNFLLTAKSVMSLTPPQRIEILQDVVNSIKSDAIFSSKVRSEHVAKVKNLAIKNMQQRKKDDHSTDDFKL